MVLFVVCLPIKQRMADNEWMYSGRVSSTQVTDEWKWKTNFLVKELAHGSKGVVRPCCPCSVCRRRHPTDMVEMTNTFGGMGICVTTTRRSTFLGTNVIEVR